jgi:hypothetical protein
MLVQQPPRQNIDTLKSMISTEMLRYETAIERDVPFREVRKIKKHINKLKILLARQERALHPDEPLTIEHSTAWL